MAYYRYLIFSFLLFLASCAQIGTISGGDEDVYAPKPISNKVVPPNESVNFTATNVEIPFDEFIRLNNPAENIVMVPPHAKVEAKVKGKTLFLNWKEDLQPNTTYAIYLNNAIQDITEKNDTIIQYVFSTGAFLDSFSYQTKVVDAWTNQPVKKCVVGLFDVDTDELVSFGESNLKGEVTLRYLAPKNYKMIAFQDENNDLKLQKHERVGFPNNDIVEISTSIVDSVPIRLFSPLLKPILRTVKFVAPGAIILGANRQLENASIFINSIQVDNQHVKVFSKDSLMVFFNTENSDAAKIVVSNDYFNDTTNLRFTDKQKTVSLSIRCAKSTNKFNPSDTVSFYINDFIQSIDTSKIKIINLSDSSIINDYSFSFSTNKLNLNIDKTDLSEISILFKEKAIICEHNNSKEEGFKIGLNLERQLGKIILDLSNYSQPIILQLIRSGKVFREEQVNSFSTPFILKELAPGEYTIKIIHDENSNGKWDVGDYDLKIQPELIDYYSSPIKVRANWDVEVKLD